MFSINQALYFLSTDVFNHAFVSTCIYAQSCTPFFTTQAHPFSPAQPEVRLGWLAQPYIEISMNDSDDINRPAPFPLCPCPLPHTPLFS